MGHTRATPQGPDYNRIADNYCQARPAVGIESIVQAFSSLNVPISRMRLLDAGCGAGGYSLALANSAENVVGIDCSAGMLLAAERNAAGHPAGHRVALVQGTMTDMPFGDNTFDGVMLNQSLQHLDTGCDGRLPMQVRALRECRRVLQPEGAITISTSSQQQILHGFWFYNLIPKAAERLRRRFMPLANLTSQLQALGFPYVQTQVMRDVVLQGDGYYDARGPLHAAWRDGDSAWSFASPAELQHAVATVRDLDRCGNLDEAFEEWDSKRKRIGQITFVYASRNPLPESTRDPNTE